jgi:hypothetical protein
MTGLVLMNKIGRPLLVVTCDSDEEATRFYEQTASRAYPGYALVSAMTVDEYRRPQ